MWFDKAKKIYSEIKWDDSDKPVVENGVVKPNCLTKGYNMKKQPKPKKNKNKAIVDLLVQELNERKKIGIITYGTPLQAFNGRDSLRDALDEALDLCVYLRQAIEERDNPDVASPRGDN